MFNTDDLVSGVLTGVMGGKRKRSKKALRYLTGQGGGLFSNPQTLLTVAGLAWGVFDTLQNQSPGQGQWGGGGSGGGLGSVPQNAPAAPAAALPPLPNIPGAPNVPPDVIRIIRLSIAAAAADGNLSDDDKARILERAREGGVEHIVEQELQHRRPLAEIAGGITDPAQRATLYVLAFGIVRADESVSGAERIFLAQLAHQLGLDPATIAKLEADAASRIDAQE
jgi:uncharacterized membrane protein YebE (DUF533 family)